MNFKVFQFNETKRSQKKFKVLNREILTELFSTLIHEKRIPNFQDGFDKKKLADKKTGLIMILNEFCDIFNSFLFFMKAYGRR